MPRPDPLVERFQLSVLPGTDIHSAAAALIHELTSPMPAGFLSGSWGTVVEDPNKIELWLTWDTLASHISFSTTSKVHAITQILIPIAASMPTVYHIAFKAPLSSLSSLSSPPSNTISEILTFTPAPKSVKFDEPEGYRGNMQGRSVERVEGRRVYVAVVQWEDGDGRGGERWVERVQAVGGGEEMEVERCHVRFLAF